MKCLSLWQPWASLMVNGIKRVETRSWPPRHTGPLLIHASTHWDATQLNLCRNDRHFIDAMQYLKVGFARTGRDRVSKPVNMPLGAVIGVVDVVAAYQTHDRHGGIRFTEPGFDLGARDSGDGTGRLLVPPVERAFGDYRPDRWVWLCSRPAAFKEPVYMRGAMGLFEVSVTKALFSALYDANYQPDKLTVI